MEKREKCQRTNLPCFIVQDKTLFFFFFLFFWGRGLGYLLILVCLRFKLNILFLRNLFQIKYFQNIQILFEKIHEIHKNAINTFFVANSRIEYLSVYFCFLLSEPQQRYPVIGIPSCRGLFKRNQRIKVAEVCLKENTQNLCSLFSRYNFQFENHVTNL